MPLSLGGNGVISGIDWAGTGGGLAHITTSSFSAAASVSVNGCFTSTYENYRIVCYMTGSTTAIDINMRLRASSADATGANYTWQGLIAISGTVTGTGTAGDTGMLVTRNLNTSPAPLLMEIQRPQIAAPTTGIWESWRAGDTYRTAHGFSHSLSTAYDGFSLIASTGTITGTVRVYGYIND